MCAVVSLLGKQSSGLYIPLTDLNVSNGASEHIHFIYGSLNSVVSVLSFLGEPMAVLVVVFGVVLGLCICTALLRWNEVRYRKKGLPPGTMGWPVAGETTEFLKQGPSFMRNQRARYGSLFKSHILGCPTIVSMDPELNRYILLNEGKGLIPGYPQSMLDILGKCNIAAVHGPLHKSMRGALLSLISPVMIREQLLPKIDKFMRSHLSNWDGKTIDIQEKTKEMALLSSLNQIAGTESSLIAEGFKPEFYKLVLGTLSLPINLPGTNYRRGFQARKNIISMLKTIIERRRASSSIHHDMLGGLLRGEDSRYKLSDEEIIDQLITILYSGYETVSTTSMMAVKFLHDHPRALEQLREEHLEIRRSKGPEDPINWNDYKSMSFTRAVILETARLATIVNGVLRKTTHEMKLNGFVIPKGWKIYVYTREVNYDPLLYPEPFTFNPWRWLDKSLESHNYFMLFGGGSRLCPGKELGVAEISTFLHYFVTRYRWEVGGDKLLKFPRVEAPNGLHIRVSSY
ncbi:PREDICTED: cytochrome P450 85A1-like [Nelumbo nucifera]|uniref:Cytochrome P450 85A1-like n=1 Tax=Nelumbo nucifera TaxID=4432 RepID=A0A1U7ZZY2_NELNU|nr:PREDICTED: cytochrome P450 85A1-like [Nelumbo nucifera]